MPLTEDQQNDILAHLNDVAEADGVQLAIENFTIYLFENWDDIINPRKMDRKALRRELRSLRAQKASNKAANTSIDLQIEEIKTQLE